MEDKEKNSDNDFMFKTQEKGAEDNITEEYCLEEYCKEEYCLEEYGLEEYGLEEYGLDECGLEQYGLGEPITEKYNIEDYIKGESANDISLPEADRIEGYLITDIELCIGKNKDYYINKFQKLPTRRVNGSAMLFEVNWMAYRHMWREGIILYFLQLIPVMIAVPFMFKGVLNGNARTMDTVWPPIIMSIIASFLLIGFFGDTIYWKKIKRELDRYNRKNSTIPMTEAEKGELQGRTQTSFIYVVISIILYKSLEKVLIYLTTLIAIAIYRMAV